jgi:recombinational DNA repair ATPase RecF
MTDKRNEYISQAQEKLDLINAQIVELEAKASETRGDARRELKDMLSGIRQSKDKAERRFEELRLASKPAWQDLKLGVEQAWDSLSDAVNRAGERFQ